MVRLAEHSPRMALTDTRATGRTQHEAALALHGVTDVHRASFAPMRIMLAGGGLPARAMAGVTAERPEARAAGRASAALMAPR